MSNSRVIPAPPAAVWAALNDPEALKASVPGCESLEPVENGSATALSYAVKAQVGGKIAQIGSRLIDAAAAKIADEFFTRFSDRVALPATVPVDETGEIVQVSAGRAPGNQPWIRWVSLAVIAAIVAYLAIRGFR
jgi:hypothetical protein